MVKGSVWYASIDLKGFFEEIPHNLILKLIRRKVADGGLVMLVATALKARMIVDGKDGAPATGTVCPLEDRSSTCGWMIGAG